ncbi:MAG: CAP domain-containing protein [Acidimicrobiales bacterium]
MSARTLVGKKAAVIAMAVLVSVGLTSCFADTSTTPPADPTLAGMYQALNQDRAAHGLPALTWSPKLQNLAGSWAHQMASVNTLYHQNLGSVISTSDFVNYHTLGENILVGPGSMTPAQMETAWMNSSLHKANILSGNYNIVGMGVFIGGDGRIWAVVDFGGI